MALVDFQNVVGIFGSKRSRNAVRRIFACFGLLENIFTRFTSYSIFTQVVAFDKTFDLHAELFRIRASINLGRIANRDSYSSRLYLEDGRNEFLYNVIRIRRSLLVELKRILASSEKSRLRNAYMDIVEFVFIQEAVHSPLEVSRSFIAIFNGISHSRNHDGLRSNFQGTVSHFKFHVRVID